MTRIVLIAAALAAALARPALAQTTDRRPQIQVVPAPTERDNNRAGQPQPQFHPSNDVYEGGTYLGSDPDPNIRLELRRNYESHD